MGTLRKATMDDVLRAVEPDGKPVDPPRVIAAQLFNVPYESVSAKMRQAGKQSMYARAYGGRRG